MYVLLKTKEISKIKQKTFVLLLIVQQYFTGDTRYSKMCGNKLLLCYSENNLKKQFEGPKSFMEGDSSWL